MRVDIVELALVCLSHSSQPSVNFGEELCGRTPSTPMNRYSVKLVAAMAFDVDCCCHAFTITNSPTQVYQPIKILTLYTINHANSFQQLITNKPPCTLIKVAAEEHRRLFRKSRVTRRNGGIKN